MTPRMLGRKALTAIGVYVIATVFGWCLTAMLVAAWFDR